MKTINIFGRKMPIVAILMALLVVGTASATVFTHYATLEGNVTVESPLHIEVDDVQVPIGSTYAIEVDYTEYPYDMETDFDFNNTHDSTIDVTVITMLFSDYGTDDEVVLCWEYDEVVSVEPGVSEYTASLDIPDYWILDGDYTFTVRIFPQYTFATSE